MMERLGKVSGLGGHWSRAGNCRLGPHDLARGWWSASLFRATCRCCCFSHRAGASLCPCRR